MKTKTTLKTNFLNLKKKKKPFISFILMIAVVFSSGFSGILTDYLGQGNSLIGVPQAQAAGEDINIPLTVSDYAGIARIGDPVTSGIPISESANITSINQFQITDSSGNNVPAQFTVTSRWRGTPDDNSKPIKWVLLDFQANVPADGTTVYYLKNGNIGNAQNTDLSLQEDNDKITVSTGKAKFEINKNYFNLFDYVHVDKDNDGQLNDVVISSVNDGGVVLTGTDGTIYRTTLEAPEEIEIEEQGPMRTVVKVRGVFKAEDGSYFAPSITDIADATKENFDELGYAYTPGIHEGRFSQPYEKSFFYYSCRIHFYNNKDYVKVFFTLENNGSNGMISPETMYAPIQVVYFDSVNLIVKQNSDSQINIVSEDSSTQLSSLDNFTLHQDWKENLTDGYPSTLEPVFEDGPYYITKKNSQQLSTGSSNPGWIDANSDSQGVGLAIRHFWQNFPKKITVDNSEIKIGLWPEEGYYPYLQQSDYPDPKYDMYVKEAGRDAGVYFFDSGRHKTHEMFLRFYSGSQDSQTQALSKSLENPLMAVASPEWFTETKALGMIGPGGLTSTDPEIDEAMERYDRLQTAMVYEEDSDNIYTILNAKTLNPPNYEWPEQSKFFGWMNFGDLRWVDTNSSLHYDWTHKMLLHYIRTGERRLFDAGVDMAKHRYDIDQYYGERTATTNHHLWLNHFQYYESDGHGSFKSKPSQPMHNWNSGIILYYLLTGDKKSLEAAEDNTKGILNWFGEVGLKDATKLGCTGEVRAEGWSMLNLISLYRVTGNPLYLETAKNIAMNRYLFTEQESGGRGVLGGRQSAGLFHTIFSTVPTECAEISDTCRLCKNTADPLFMGYVIEGLIAVHQETQDEELGAMLVRATDFLKDRMIFGGDYDEDGNYRTLRVAKMWVEEDPYGEIRVASGYNKDTHWGYPTPIYTLFWADYFAYAYQLTNNSEYLDWARRCFRDMMFYYITPTEYVDPEYRAVISYKDNQFSLTHTKIHGWIGRFSQIYLNVEWQLQQGELQIVSNSLPDGTINSVYSYPLSAGGGTSPYAYLITAGSLPNGLSINATTGAISGTPTTEGTFSFTIQIQDSSFPAQTASKELSIKINAEEVPETDTTPPTASISISDGDTHTNTQNSTINISATDPSGVTEMKISNTNDFNTIPEEYKTTKSLTLTAGDGIKTVYAWFKDTLGNWTEEASPITDTIILDTIAPSKIEDFSVSATAQTSINLAWTSTGNDNYTNTAKTYDLRYSTSNITSENWKNATQATGEPIPQIAGSDETYTVVGLIPNTTYRFAVKTIDQAGNISELSNVIEGKTNIANKYMLNLRLRDGSGNIIRNAKVRVYTDSEDILPNFTFSGAEKAIEMEEGLKRHIEYLLPQRQKLTIKEFALSKDTTLNPQFINSYEGTLPNQMQSRSSIVALDDTGLDYSNAEITLSTTGEISHILHCANWNFETATCVENNWEIKPLTDYNYTLDSENNLITLTNITSFDAYLAVYGETPHNIADLSASDPTTNSIKLSWTVPENQENAIANYDFRYSTENITDDNWDSATEISNEPLPTTVGTTQTLTVSNLTSGTAYYFAAKTRDTESHESELSNIANQITTSPSSGGGGGGGGGYISDTTPPAQPKNFEAVPENEQINLTWENPTDSDFVRVKILRRCCSAPTAHNDSTAEVIYEGTEEEYTDTNLEENITYYYSIFAYDKKPNYSEILTIQAQSESAEETYPAGTLIKIPESFRIYVMINNKKKWISTPEVFETLGYQWGSITLITKEELNLIPDYEDNLIREINGYKVYLVVNGFRRHIPNPEIFLDYGFLWEDVKDVSQETINKYQRGYLIRESKQGKIYYLREDGIKKHIPSPEIFSSYNNKWEDIQVISQKEMNAYHESNLIQLQGDTGIFLLENNMKRHISNAEIFNRHKFNWNHVVTVNETEFEWYKAGSGV